MRTKQCQTSKLALPYDTACLLENATEEINGRKYVTLDKAEEAVITSVRQIGNETLASYRKMSAEVNNVSMNCLGKLQDMVRTAYDRPKGPKGAVGPKGADGLYHDKYKEENNGGH